MPVPAVCGGAIETLITSIVKKYSKKDGFRLTIFSVYHKEAVEAAKKYPEVRFVWTHTNTFWNLSKHAVFMAIRALNGKTIRVLQRHYNEIAPVIQKEKFDLLIVEGGDEKAIIDIAKGYKREQLAFHAHVHFIPEKQTVKGFGNLIAVSEFVKKEYIKACSIPVKAHVLRNAIDVKKFSRVASEEQKSRLRKKLGLSDNDFVVLFVGRIMEIKSVLELMRAVIELDDPHIKLLIMGSANSGKWSLSSYERKAKQFAEQHKDRIKFTGYVENTEVYTYAAIADVQCLPTKVEEAAPLVVLEAMAEGLPLIVTKSGGVVEYIDDTVALLIEKDNLIDNLKAAICHMEQHPEVRKQMSQNARAQSKKYDEVTYYKKFVDTIFNVIEENIHNDNA